MKTQVLKAGPEQPEKVTKRRNTRLESITEFGAKPPNDCVLIINNPFEIGNNKRSSVQDQRAFHPQCFSITLVHSDRQCFHRPESLAGPEEIGGEAIRRFDRSAIRIEPFECDKVMAVAALQQRWLTSLLNRKRTDLHTLHIQHHYLTFRF
jgi:hypothetical protein